MNPTPPDADVLTVLVLILAIVALLVGIALGRALERRDWARLRRSERPE